MPRRTVAQHPASPKVSPKASPKAQSSAKAEARLELRLGTGIIPRCMTIPEAAAYLGSTIWFVRTTIWSGEIPATRYGKRFVIDRRDLDAFIERNKTTKTTITGK